MTNEQRFRGCSWLSLLLAVALFHSAHANGNVISEGGKAFTYDSDNHLVTVGSPTATIVYDGFGNRVAKTVTANGVPTTTLYLVDELNPTGYAQVVEELSSAGAVERQYTYGLQRIDENQRIESVWTASFYGYDGGGSVRQLTSSAGAVTDSYEYDAFGNALVTSGSTPNSYLYRGEQFDPDLGLYYLRARYYNPVTGRFMSRDPEDGDFTNPKTLHKYLYANGDPVNLADPTGRAAAAPTMPGQAVGGFEYAALILNIAIRAIPAVAAVGCALNISFTMDQLKVAGYTDVMPVWYLCSARGKRVSCRYNVNIHIIGTPNHDSVGPFVGNATGRGCTEACSEARADAYAQATVAAAGRPYHIIHEKQYCRE